MASHFLLLFFLFTTASTTTETPAPTPLHHSLPSPFPHSHCPPRYPPSTNHETHFNSIIDALTQTDDFKNWAHFLSLTLNPSLIPVSATATLFVPSDDALSASINLSPPQTPFNLMDPLLFPYHIIPRRLSFNSLCHFPNKARLPTLLHGFSLLITNHSTTNFTINSAHIIRPNLYRNAFVSVHGIDSILDYTLFGKDPPPSSPPPSPTMPKYNAREVAVSGDRKKVDPPVYHQVHTSDAPRINGLYLASLVVSTLLWIARMVLSEMGDGSRVIW